jgi:hypothetical protein
MQKEPGHAASLARGIARDIAALSGAGLVSYGAWLVYQPAGFITLGAILLAACVAGVPSNRAPS